MVAVPTRRQQREQRERNEAQRRGRLANAYDEMQRVNEQHDTPAQYLRIQKVFTKAQREKGKRGEAFTITPDQGYQIFLIKGGSRAAVPNAHTYDEANGYAVYKKRESSFLTRGQGHFNPGLVVVDFVANSAWVPGEAGGLMLLGGKAFENVAGRAAVGGGLEAAHAGMTLSELDETRYAALGLSEAEIAGQEEARIAATVSKEADDAYWAGLQQTYDAQRAADSAAAREARVTEREATWIEKDTARQGDEVSRSRLNYLYRRRAKTQHAGVRDQYTTLIEEMEAQLAEKQAMYTGDNVAQETYTMERIQYLRDQLAKAEESQTSIIANSYRELIKYEEHGLARQILNEKLAAQEITFNQYEDVMKSFEQSLESGTPYTREFLAREAHYGAVEPKPPTDIFLEETPEWEKILDTDEIIAAEESLENLPEFSKAMREWGDTYTTEGVLNSHRQFVEGGGVHTVLPEEYHEAFDFTNQSYYPKGERTNVGNWKYREDLSSTEIGVWVDDVEKKLHITHRGSVELVKDWIRSDGTAIFPGLEEFDPRFAEALQHTKDMHAQFPEYVIEGSAHSLGGGIQSYVSKKLVNEPWFAQYYGQQVQFNGATSPFGAALRDRIALTAEERAALDKVVTHVRQNADLVSITPQAFGKRVNLRTTMNPYEAHLMTSFTQPAITDAQMVRQTLELMQHAARTGGSRAVRAAINASREALTAAGKNADLILRQAFTDYKVEYNQMQAGHTMQEHTQEKEDGTVVFGADAFAQQVEHEKTTPDTAAPRPVAVNPPHTEAGKAERTLNPNAASGTTATVTMGGTEYECTKVNPWECKPKPYIIPKPDVCACADCDCKAPSNEFFDDGFEDGEFDIGARVKSNHTSKNVHANERTARPDLQNYTTQQETPPVRILGYALYPANLAPQYVNQYVEFR